MITIEFTNKEVLVLGDLLDAVLGPGTPNRDLGEAWSKVRGAAETIKRPRPSQRP